MDREMERKLLGTRLEHRPNQPRELEANIPCRLNVDTTADRTIVRRLFLAQAGLRPFLVSIDQSSVPQYRPEGVGLGEYWLRFSMLLGVDTLPTDLPADPLFQGVLGMDWLTPHIARVCFDFAASAVLLWPTSGESLAE